MDISYEEVKNAMAPYNFVSLNRNVLNSPLDRFYSDARFAFEEYQKNKNQKRKSLNDFVQEYFGKYITGQPTYTGYFDITMTNVTPLYIGSNNGCFKIGDKHWIPGSSLRGCIKNLFKILTASKFTSYGNNPDFEEKTLYFRSIGSLHDSFDKAYKSKLLQEQPNGKFKSKALVGFLVKDRKKYFIYESDVTLKDVTVPFPEGFQEPDKPTIEWKNNFVRVHTGRMEGKKHYYEIPYPKRWAFSSRLEVPEHLEKSYGKDSNRKGINLLKSGGLKRDDPRIRRCPALKSLNFDYIVPCFFTATGNEVDNFGSGPIYRVSYTKSIGSHVPYALKGRQIDFSDAVFGYERYWASRVYFEDLSTEDNEVTLESNVRKVLSSPNPTSFQIYLKPNENGIAAHWDENTNIRGYKMYWHRNPDWIGKVNKNTKFNSYIEPLAENHTFKGRIRFENLTAMELGALVKVLELGKDINYCYKIGGGKPLGLGSVNISANLHIRDNIYYKQLFDGESFNSAKHITDTSEFVAVFENYVDKHLDRKQYDATITELKNIMDIRWKEQEGWNDQTRYLDINSEEDKEIFKHRKPMLTINELVGKK